MASAADAPALVRRLRSNSRVRQLQAAQAVAALAAGGGEAPAEAVVAAGGIAALLRLLGRVGEAVQLTALRALACCGRYAASA